MKMMRLSSSWIFLFKAAATTSIVSLLLLSKTCESFISEFRPTTTTFATTSHRETTTTTIFRQSIHDADGGGEPNCDRRAFLSDYVLATATLSAATMLGVDAADAVDDTPVSSSQKKQRSTSDAVVTDKIFLDVDVTDGAGGRVVIGLFGNDAPGPASILKRLASEEGYATPCRPKAVRALQREQLEANKVYNACVAAVDEGVTYDSSTVWRVDRDKRVDAGAVQGRFTAREFPDFRDNDVGNGDAASSRLTHDAPGVVSVRRGDDGGFGFTLVPPPSSSASANEIRAAREQLDAENVVVGRVLEGTDVLARINEAPVVRTSSSLNYMALTGGPTGRAAPSRACRYGGPMYCNELKPLKKITVTKCGVLK